MGEKRKIWFDQKCYDLAEHFIGSEQGLERLCEELAGYIQVEIEAFLEDRDHSPSRSDER